MPIALKDLIEGLDKAQIVEILSFLTSTSDQDIVDAIQQALLIRLVKLNQRKR